MAKSMSNVEPIDVIDSRSVNFSENCSFIYCYIVTGRILPALTRYSMSAAKFEGTFFPPRISRDGPRDETSLTDLKTLIWYVLLSLKCDLD